jgi:hypothetical protein
MVLAAIGCMIIIESDSLTIRKKYNVSLLETHGEIWNYLCFHIT